MPCIKNKFFSANCLMEILHKYFPFISRIKGNSDLGFIFGLFAAVFLLVIPVHKDLLSVLLVFSIAISLLILLIRVMHKALETRSIRFASYFMRPGGLA